MLKAMPADYLGCFSADSHSVPPPAPGGLLGAGPWLLVVVVAIDLAGP